MSGSGESGRWKNEGEATYKERFGEADWDRYSREEFPDPMPPFTAWTKAELFAKSAAVGSSLAVGIALPTRMRPTHKLGVAGAGTIKIVDDPAFPEHEFFKAGRVFPARARHATLRFTDDAALDGRSASLKFEDCDGDAPLVINMNSGGALFTTVNTVFDFNVATTLNKLDEYLHKHPSAWVKWVDTVRRDPESFARCSFNGFHVYGFNAADGRQLYCKYRLVPWDGWESIADDSGLPDREDQTRMWIGDRLPGDPRPTDYLRAEYKARLARETAVRHRLQIQVRDYDPRRDTQEFFNGARDWEVPWLALAEVTMTRVLDDEVTERSKWDIANRPPSLPIVEAFSNDDYNGICWTRARWYGRSAELRQAFGLRQVDAVSPGTSYHVVIETDAGAGDANAGAEATLAMQLSGERGESDTFTLTVRAADLAERRIVDQTVVLRDLGDLRALTVDGGAALASLHVREIAVVTTTAEGTVRFRFPVGASLGARSTLRVEVEERQASATSAATGACPFHQTAGETRVPQDAFEDHLQVRIGPEVPPDPYLAGRRAAYGFTQTRIPASMNTIDPEHYGPGRDAGRQVWPLLPPFIETYDAAVFKEQGYDRGDVYQIVHAGLEGYADRAVAGIADLGGSVAALAGSLLGRHAAPITTLTQLDEHLRGLYADGRFHFMASPTPHVWLADDEEYARQRLAGANPTLLEAWRRPEAELSALITGLPESDAGAVRAAAAGGRLFWVDYRSRLSCITHVLEGESLAVQAVALFVRDERRLMPAAIRLEDDGPWFTPADGFAWLLAKIHATTAETQDQGTRAHLLCTHLLHETYAIAMERAFSEHHPIRRLLDPHLRYTITINELARKMMVNQGGNIDLANSGGRMATFQQVNHTYRKLRFGDLGLPADVAARGVGADALPIAYPYRDDGLALWSATRAFCADIVGVFYRGDADVVADAELRGFTEELARELNRGARDAPDIFDPNTVLDGSFERFPARLSTVAELVDTLCTIVFGTSFLHAAVNGPQFDFYGYVPNGAMLLRRPPPRTKAVTADDILAALPSRSQAMFQAAFMLQLSTPSDHTLLRPDTDDVAYLSKVYGFRSARAGEVVQGHTRRLLLEREALLARQAARRSAYLTEHPETAPSDVPPSVTYPYLDPTRVHSSVEI